MIIYEVKSHTVVREAETNFIFGTVLLSEFALSKGEQKVWRAHPCLSILTYPPPSGITITRAAASLTDGLARTHHHHPEDIVHLGISLSFVHCMNTSKYKWKMSCFYWWCMGDFHDPPNLFPLSSHLPHSQPSSYWFTETLIAYNSEGSKWERYIV